MAMLQMTEQMLRELYEMSYYAITHEKDYETWRDEKVAKGIVEIA